MTSSPHQFLELLYRALQAPLGIVVSTSDPERSRAKFYEARSEAKNPAFEALVFTPSRTAPQGELWIVRKPQGPN